MIVCCVDCKMFFDDEFRFTFCPHDAFPANDGKNSFKIHNDSYYSKDPPPKLNTENRPTGIHTSTHTT